jgi:hypothetical protein
MQPRQSGQAIRAFAFVPPQFPGPHAALAEIIRNATRTRNIRRDFANILFIIDLINFN